MRSVSLGLLVAAAGIGGSDVSMAALTGSRFGYMLLWAIVLGAGLKFVLNEGVARWQLATGETFVSGICRRLGPWARIAFFIYLIPWTFAVGASLMSACATVTATALDAGSDWSAGAVTPSRNTLALIGLGHSLVAVVLVLSGGYTVFRRVMGVLTTTMVLLVLAAALMTRPDAAAFFSSLFVPRVPLKGEEGVQWTLALIGGVGGTVTMLAYGYWNQDERPAESGTECEHGDGAAGGGRAERTDRAGGANEADEHAAGRADDGAARNLPERFGYRLDLAVAYGVTAIFGLALTVISADVPVHESGANLFHAVASRLAQTIGPFAGWIYIAGAWCAVWACMLGVWQFVPLLFDDLLSAHAKNSPTASRAGERTARTPREASRTRTYRVSLLALATVPVLGIWLDFADVQRAFGLLGSLFIPMLAVALLLMNNRRAWIGARANRLASNALLVAVLIVTAVGVAMEVMRWL